MILAVEMFLEGFCRMIQYVEDVRFLTSRKEQSGVTPAVLLYVLLKVDGEVAEDRSCLKKSTDVQHINVVEMDVVLREFDSAVK